MGSVPSLNYLSLCVFELWETSYILTIIPSFLLNCSILIVIFAFLVWKGAVSNMVPCMYNMFLYYITPKREENGNLSTRYLSFALEIKEQ